MRIINLALKRLFDILSTFVVILLLIPLWIIVPIIIKCDSKGPVFFIQKRRTKNGKVFKMLKFRSMVVNAEKTGTGLFNYENDVRITKFGKFLRKSSIDELPQLFNIFIGQMSVIGPRPCVEYELGEFETLNKRYKKRFQMKAGLTGLAQTKGRNSVGWDAKVEFDNEYIDKFKKYGVLFDIKILFQSVFKVAKKNDIVEQKVEGATSDEESARLAEEEIIRLAHIPDEEKEATA